MEDKKRLIDAGAYRKILAEYADCEHNPYLEQAFAVAIEKLRDMPTIDAVEVVRCKDCIFYHKRLGIGFGKCSKTSIYPYAEDFCSYGERRTDA